MQPLLRILLSGLIVLAHQTAIAQCNIFNPAVKLNSSSPNTTTGGCNINLDLYFDMQSNAGGKFVYIHIWPKALYPTLTYNNPPNLTQLSNAVATLGFYHFGGSLYMLDSYTPFPTVPNFKFTGLSIVKGAGSTAGSDRFTIQNININTTATCSIAQEFTADVWQSQSASAQNVHCFSRGLNFFANDPRVIGFLICEPPRQFRFQIRTIDPLGLTVNYKVFIDNGDGVYNASTDNIEIAAASGIALNSTNSFTFNSPLLGYLPYSNQKPEADRALWIVVTSATRDNATLARLDNNCALLPIEWGDFSVKWTGRQAKLEWSTRTEIDNQGFEIERKEKDDAAPFRTIGSLPSQASGGHSQMDLYYSFIDPTPLSGTVLYRIKQIDQSGKIGYSSVRSLSASPMASQLYPNPVQDQLTLIFPSAQIKYIVECYNDTGQRVGQWNARDRLLLSTQALPNGAYRIRITDAGTGRAEIRSILIQHLQ